MELRPYQQNAVDAAWRYFGAGKDCGLLVIPTGAGKTCIAGEIIRRTYGIVQNRKFLLLAPRQELLEQIELTVRKMIPDVHLGVYCASMKRKEAGRKVTVGMVNSLYRKAGAVGYVNLVIVDECHLIPHEDSGMYRTLFKELKTYNPNLKILGLTATPYRMKEGLLTEDGLFDDVVHEVSVRDLIEQGYLARLVSKIPKTQADLSEVKSAGGEFILAQMEAAMDKESLTAAAVTEIEEYGRDRQRWLIFAAGIQHAEHVAEEIRRRGYTAEAVSSENDSLFRKEHIRRFREGTLRCLVNCQILTTGFDVPSVDLIGMLRPTKSVGLYQQIVGRGLRPVYADGFDLDTSDGRLAAMAAGPKKDCLVLDFSGNLERHGPIDAIRITRRMNPLTKESESSIQTAPIKRCPTCHSACLISAKECGECGHIFPLPILHAPTASTASILSKREAETWVVSSVDYKKHEKDGKPPSLKVTYGYAPIEGGLKTRSVSEWVCIEHPNFAGDKATDWWVKHSGGECSKDETPLTVDEALTRLDELKKVAWIKIVKDGEFDRVLDFGIDESAKEEEEFFDKMQLNIF